MLGSVHGNEQILTGLRRQHVEAVRCWVERSRVVESDVKIGGAVRCIAQTDGVFTMLVLGVRSRKWYGQIGSLGGTGMPTERCLIVGRGDSVARRLQNDDGLRCVEELTCNVLVLIGESTRR